MLHFSLARSLSLSIHTKNSRLFTQHLPTIATSAEKFYTHMQKNPNNIEKSLSNVNAQLDSTCVNQVLNRCFPSQSLMGIRFFVWAGLQSSYRHSSFMYDRACELFKITRNPSVFNDVIEAYRKEGCIVSVRTMKVLLNLCEKAGLADEALWVLRRMPEFNLRADSVMYNVIIRLFCDKGDMVMADNLMKDMGLIDLYPNMITYVLMIKGFCNVGRLDDACGLLMAMRRHGCTPNSVVYSVLLDGVYRLGSTERALGLLDEMEKDGGDCSPNVVTYTSVIQVFCEKGMMIEALGILDRMEAYGCAPNRVTVSTLIKGFCAEGKVEEAYMLIDRVVAGGSVSSGECYSSLVVELIRIKRPKEAEKLFREMLANGVKPDGLACSLMIKELCLEGHVLDGFFLYEKIEKIGCLSSIDSDIHSMLLVGLCQESHSAEAAKLAGFMLGKRIRLKASSFDKIVEHLKKSGDEDLVKHLTRIGR
ncbi:hypothetical protein QYF36_008962 [Acer negundo]|nr:hypothetical protein QYF36_008962 [Acer negundo]